MDVAVDEDAAGVSGVVHEEAGRVELVAGLRSDYGWPSDVAAFHACVGVAVAGVEAPAEAAHYFQVWVAFCGVDYGLGDGDISAERLDGG